MAKIKAIIIDPNELGSIYETEIENSLEGLQGAIGDRYIELVRVDEFNDMYVDEEGLFVDNQSYFQIHAASGSPVNLAGKAVIVGNTPDGKQSDVKVLLETIKQRIVFLGKR